MNISVVSDIECFGALKSEWNALLKTCGNNTLFLRWEWMYYYYDSMCSGHELCLLLARDDEGRLVGIAPFILREERILTKRIVLEFIGQNYSYHLGIIADGQNRDGVYQAVCDYLFENRQWWDLINLSHLSDDETLKEYMRRHAKGRGYGWREGIQDPCKVVQVKGSFDDYLSSLDKEFVTTLRHKLHKLRSDCEIEVSVPKAEEELEVYWSRFLDLHIGAIQGRGATTILSKHQFQRFYHRVALAAYREGTLALMALKLGQKICAIKYAIVMNNTCYFVNSGYDRASKHSLYLLSTVLCIEDLLERGVEYFDFAGGGGPHKEKLGGVDKDGLYIQVAKPIPALERAVRTVAGKIVRKVHRS